jgi:hypothetical protein
LTRRRAAAATLAASLVAAVLIVFPGGSGSPGAAAASPAAWSAQTRYSLVHGCYVVRTAAGRTVASGDEPFRMQAAALDQYLLYGVHRDYLGSGAAPAKRPGSSTVWQVGGDAGRGFTITDLGTGQRIPVSFLPASGCAVFPEAGVDAKGVPFTGASPEAQVSGTIDAHTHVTAFEFLGGDWHCGRPWSPYGVAYALPNCAPDEQGTNGQVESFVDYGQPAHQHDTQGWPTFRDWPSPTDLAEEGDYYTGIKRAWMAGLRVMVTQLVDNEALCGLMTKRHNPCNDMQSVRIQAADLKGLQNYIDAQSGGPGKGFFRIVTNPFQARQAINQGKLAVVEGIEVSHLFNCGEYLGVPDCSPAKIDAGLKEVRALGVSTFFPVHKFDNAFGGTKMDSGELGVLINGGNHLETGHFWDVKTCTGPEHDSTQLTSLPTGALAQLLTGPAARLLPSGSLPSGTVPTSVIRAGSPTAGALPVYPPPPHCNQRGLTSLGAYLINQMVRRHFIVELDHMDAKTADATLSILEAHHYSGVVSAHSWDSPEENPRIYNLGGFVTPIAGASPGAFVAQWKASRSIRNPRFLNGLGFGYGADMNGLAEESQPTAANPIHYPFKSYDGRVTFTREVWGQRTFDLNKDGVANYGMFADWLQELNVLAGRPILTDMFHGAEAYLEMWERAEGVPASRCQPATGRFTGAGVGALRLGATSERVLYATGQPAARPGTAYRYCVAGASGASLTAVFNHGGQAAVIVTGARGYSTGAARPGTPFARLRASARKLAAGLWVSRARLAHGARFVYGIRGNRVSWVAVAAGSELGSLSRLRADLRAAGR